MALNFEIHAFEITLAFERFEYIDPMNQTSNCGPRKIDCLHHGPGLNSEHTDEDIPPYAFPPCP